MPESAVRARKSPRLVGLPLREHPVSSMSTGPGRSWRRALGRDDHDRMLLSFERPASPPARAEVPLGPAPWRGPLPSSRTLKTAQ